MQLCTITNIFDHEVDIIASFTRLISVLNDKLHAPSMNEEKSAVHARKTFSTSHSISLRKAFHFFRSEFNVYIAF